MPNNATEPPSRLRDSWLLGRHEWMQMAMAFIALVGVGTAIGVAMVGDGRENVVTRIDDRVVEWFAYRRTPRLDTLSLIGSMLAETAVKVAVTVVIVATMLALWRRWLEPSVVVAALVLEASVFITVTVLVGRPRPDAVALDESPVSSSFPSGHTAAAAAYGALVVVLAWRGRRRLIGFVGWTIVAMITAIVGVSRMYRGMHHLSDVVFGAVLGVVCVVVVSTIVNGAAVRRSHVEQTRSSPVAPRPVAGSTRG